MIIKELGILIKKKIFFKIASSISEKNTTISTLVYLSI